MEGKILLITCISHSKILIYYWSASFKITMSKFVNSPFNTPPNIETVSRFYNEFILKVLRFLSKTRYSSRKEDKKILLFLDLVKNLVPTFLRNCIMVFLVKYVIVNYSERSLKILGIYYFLQRIRGFSLTHRNWNFLFLTILNAFPN